MIRIRDYVNEHGVSNVVIGHPARPLGVNFYDFHEKDYPQEIKMFYIDETTVPNRVISDGYKIHLKCSEPGYHDEDYYQLDLESLMEEQPELYFFVTGK